MQKTSRDGITLAIMFSFLLSAAAISIIGYKWSHVQGRPLHKVADEFEIRNDADFKRWMEDFNAKPRKFKTAEFKGRELPQLVPTGFYIQSLAFVSPTDVNLTGYIWQEYPDQEHPPAEPPPQEETLRGPERESWKGPGIIFPEEVNSSSTTFRPAHIKKYKTAGGKQRTRYAWYFDVTVRQTFDYSHYPLDKVKVWLRIWRKDFEDDVNRVLVPDFDSISLEQGKIKQPVKNTHGEWTWVESYYSYRDVKYFAKIIPAREGDKYDDPSVKGIYKELRINLVVKRKFISPFVINLVPLFIVALLLFAQLMTVSEHKTRIKMLGFSVHNTVVTCSALFFVVILAHIQVRKQFVGSGLVYIEYFYFMMYGLLLLTALNAFLFSLGEQKRFNLIHYRDNLIPKLAFWPVTLWLMALATLLKF